MVAEKWMVHSKKADFDGFAKVLGVSPIVARIMRNKDLETIDEQRRFLNNSLENLHNPSLKCPAVGLPTAGYCFF